MGADIVTHSTTKYMDGHAMCLGGAIVDSGNFDWSKYPDKYPGLCQPDESYHGITYTEKFGKLAYITKATSQLMRDLGSAQSPQNSFLLNIGLETLHLRVPRHCENARKVAAIVTHVADARTCVLHPASHTHRQMTDAQLVESGVAPDLIRFSVGIENADDIIADLEQALRKI